MIRCQPPFPRLLLASLIKVRKKGTVDFEVPPYAIVGGDPARVMGWAKRQK